jgi:hypothetical protein
VAQSPMAYTVPRGAPLTLRCASVSIALRCTWFGSRSHSLRVNGFIAIPVDHNAKLLGIVCLVITSAPVFSSRVRLVYTTWVGWTDSTLEDCLFRVRSERGQAGGDLPRGGDEVDIVPIEFVLQQVRIRNDG